MPKIVIYCASGKENAQLVLHKIYNAFRYRKGLGIAPRYNQPVTDCIYYAQGNGDDKTDEFADLFESNRIHYRHDVTGQKEDYHLTMPGTWRWTLNGLFYRMLTCKEWLVFLVNYCRYFGRK